MGSFNRAGGKISGFHKECIRRIGALEREYRDYIAPFSGIDGIYTE